MYHDLNCMRVTLITLWNKWDYVTEQLIDIYTKKDAHIGLKEFVVESCELLEDLFVDSPYCLLRGMFKS